jgi:hypothetical protein
MDQSQRHEMILEVTHASGAEEWSCPTCGRRMTITWQPWKKIVLEQGDIYAAHNASKGGLRMGITTTSQGNDGNQEPSMGSSSEDPYLAPWMKWLENVDLDDLANGGN